MPRKKVEIDICDECDQIGVLYRVYVGDAGFAERILCDKHGRPAMKLIESWRWIPRGSTAEREIKKTDVAKLLGEKK